MKPMDLWDVLGDLPEEDIEEAANQMNEFYFIEDYGAAYVCGFCD